ncbi:MAG: diaminobutyrate acetyltransferase [Acidimicrobiales bacterium]
MTAHPADSPTPPGHDLELAHPTVTDGPVLHELAAAAGGLDVNTRYAYLIWARDFAHTTVIARRGGEPVGAITGYRRPDADDTLFVWQVAVDPSARRRGVAAAMLAWLAGRHVEGGGRWVEATVTPSNEASRRLFTRFADDASAPVAWSALFGADELGDGHEPEELVRIGPLR